MSESFTKNNPVKVKVIWKSYPESAEDLYLVVEVVSSL